IFVFSHFYYMFICNFMGQKIIDSSTEIFRKAYDTQWYMAPLQMQKLLLFMMQRSVKSCNIVMGGLYFVSLEQFTTVTCITDIINLTFSFPQNNKFIFLACEHVSVLLHNNLFCTTMKLVKRMET
ncbi:hypothetical protein G5I_10343, partial [Acromyrmex echinatior]